MVEFSSIVDNVELEALELRNILLYQNQCCSYTQALNSACFSWRKVESKYLLLDSWQLEAIFINANLV